MKKGIAIPIILLLIAGTLTAGIIVYQVYRTTSGPALSENDCKADMISWCTGCSLTGWRGGDGMSNKLKDCATKYWGISHNDCSAKYDCSSFLPEGSSGDTACSSNGDCCSNVGDGPCRAGEVAFCNAGKCECGGTEPPGELCPIGPPV